jgi:hypothetical protein
VTGCWLRCGEGLRHKAATQSDHRSGNVTGRVRGQVDKMRISWSYLLPSHVMRTIRLSTTGQYNNYNSPRASEAIVIISWFPLSFVIICTRLKREPSLSDEAALIHHHFSSPENASEMLKSTKGIDLPSPLTPSQNAVFILPSIGLGFQNRFSTVPGLIQMNSLYMISTNGEPRGECYEKDSRRTRRIKAERKANWAEICAKEKFLVS